jgi:hypothetical protein
MDIINFCGHAVLLVWWVLICIISDRSARVSGFLLCTVTSASWLYSQGGDLGA